eukprot:1160966-Pelagomonas_calceolata.AAC.11
MPTHVQMQTQKQTCRCALVTMCFPSTDEYKSSYEPVGACKCPRASSAQTRDQTQTQTQVQICRCTYLLLQCKDKYTHEDVDANANANEDAWLHVPAGFQVLH